MKRIIRSLLDKVKNFYYALEEAYEMTYKETSKNFNSEVEKRREKNKSRYIKLAKDFIKEQCLKETGQRMPDDVADMFAQEFLKLAVARGDVDYMYNLRKESL